MHLLSLEIILRLIVVSLKRVNLGKVITRYKEVEFMKGFVGKRQDDTEIKIEWPAFMIRKN